MTSTVLELAISMMLLYLIISGFCSAIQEFVANWLRWRSSTLEDALKKMLRDPDAANKIYGHALAAGLWSPAWLRKNNPRKPSYIPSGTFARILLDLHNNQGLTKATSEIVVKLTQDVPNDFEKQRKALEKWFDDSMDRVSGSYKRKAHAYLWLIAVLVCAALNADTIGLSRLLWNDEALRQSVVSAATKYVKDYKPLQKPAATNTKDDKLDKKADGEKLKSGQNTPPKADCANSDAPSAPHQHDSAAEPPATPEDVKNTLNGVRTALNDSSLPLGWCDNDS